MSKRDDDSADMEVGMTTAERRRRRRRGGGLRVPSDNVPRRANPPVVAPVPEDPSLAMSIAYSFSNDASEPIPRVALETPPAGQPALSKFPDPVAPEPATTVPTLIDAPVPTEGDDFEMKTREMNAVDLEALGLSSTSNPNLSLNLTATDPELDIKFQQRESTEVIPDDEDDDREVEIEMSDADSAATLDADAEDADDSVEEVEDSDSGSVSVSLETPDPDAHAPVRRGRLKTVALSDEDLEEVREAVRAASIAPAVEPKPVESKPAPAAAATAKPEPVTNKTMPLAPIDIEVERNEEAEPMSVPEIDIQELSERASESGEIEVNVDDGDDDKPAAAAAADKEPKRTRAASVPPPVAPTAQGTNPGVHAPTNGHHPASAHQPPPTPPTPPPAPPAAHKAPPTPPPAPAKKPEPAKPAAPAASMAEKARAGEGKRGKPWFVDLFDEDYLRTLPFLTPQATQAEAEFVIDAMGLSPGAQVLDVGCGYGRHAMELAARGYHVVGLDLSTPLLIRGGEEAQRRGLQINFVRGDMRELDFETQFDGAYCLFSTFGYFDDETNKKTVANIARALKPGGRVMIEILNRDYVIADLPTRVWWEGDGCVVLEEVELNYFSSRIQVNRSVVFDDGRQLEQEISVRAYSLHEVGKLMHAAGFRVLEVSGGYHTRGRFFGNQSRHIIVLAERKEASSS